MSAKLTAKDRYPETFEQARDILVMAQAKLIRNAGSMTRAQIDVITSACRAMHLRRPRSLAALIDACMLLSQHSKGDSLSADLRRFQDIIDQTREREHVRKSMRLVEGGKGQ